MGSSTSGHPFRTMAIFQFAVQVNKWVVDWIKGDVRAFMPPHVKRYILRDLYTCCPAGRFRH